MSELWLDVSCYQAIVGRGRSPEVHSSLREGSDGPLNVVSAEPDML